MIREAELTTVPLLDLKEQYASIRDELLSAIGRVVESQRFIMGPEVEGLEQEVAAYSGCGFGIGVSSGTDALLVALMALGIGAGDEVITTPYSFFATAGCVARLGARPVFVDIDSSSYNIDPALIGKAITPRTKAIIPVHLYGQMAEMDRIMELADEHGIGVIEDAAQAIGSEIDGRRAGSIGKLGCFSFFPSKNLGGFGDGGMVTTNDNELADRIRVLRNHGHRRKYYNEIVGGNFRLDALQAAVLRVKLKYLDGWTARRQQNAANYRRLFNEAGLALSTVQRQGGDRGVIVLPDERSGGRHIYNQFVIRTPRREGLRTFLQEKSIGTEVYYPFPLHLQKCFEELEYKAGDMPETEAASNETLALPIYPELKMRQQEYVVRSIKEFLG